MQVPGAQDVQVQVTSEGKALVEIVEEVLLLLLLMACTVAKQGAVWCNNATIVLYRKGVRECQCCETMTKVLFPC